jgi:hypothetical protein
MATKSPTIVELKALLKLAEVSYSSKDKKDDLILLCQNNGLIAKPPPEYKTVEKTCVVKCALKKAMSLNEEEFGKFRGHVDDLVNVVSRMLRRSSLVLAFHVTRLMEDGLPIPDMYDMKDTYWKNWLQIGIENVFPDEESRISYEAVKTVIGQVLGSNSSDYIESYPCYFDQVLNYAGHTLSTVVSNNAWVPLIPRLTRLTKATLNTLRCPSSIRVYDVMSAIQNGVYDMESWPESVKEYVHEVREKLGVGDGDRLFDDYGKTVKFHTMVRFNYWMQTRLETMGERRIRLMPIFSVQRAHVRLDLKTLINLFNRMFPKDPNIIKFSNCEYVKNPDRFMLPHRPESKTRKNCSAAEWEEFKLVIQKYNDKVKEIKNTEEYIHAKSRYDMLINARKTVVSSFFKKPPVKTGWEFDGSICTDGVSLSMQYSKSVQVCVSDIKKTSNKRTNGDKLVNIAEHYDSKLNTTLPDMGMVVLGVDPGRSNIATVTYLAEEKNKTWKLTRGAFYHNSGIKKQKRQQDKRFAGMTPLWASLREDGAALNTSRTADIFAYLSKYAMFSDKWWALALRRRESRDNFQRYIGKRKVLDSFWARIKRDMMKELPDLKVRVAYGSAIAKMKATGPGEVAVPTGAMFASCKRIFKEQVHVTDEFKTTLMSWETGAKKELVYRIPSVSLTTEGHVRLGDSFLCHTPYKKPPRVDEYDQFAVKMYHIRKKIQDKHRRGGLATSLVDFNPSIERYPEVRGLRFSPEISIYSDRDRSSALTIARLHCMELMGLGRPRPFSRCRAAN